MEVSLGVQGAGSHQVLVSQVVLSFQLALGVERPGFQFGPGPAGFHHLGIDLLVGLSPVLHLVEQVFRVLVQAGDGGLGFFQGLLLALGLPGGVLCQQLGLEVQDVWGDEGVDEELEHHPVQPCGVHGQCGAWVRSLGGLLGAGVVLPGVEHAGSTSGAVGDAGEEMDGPVLRGSGLHVMPPVLASFWHWAFRDCRRVLEVWCGCRFWAPLGHFCLREARAVSGPRVLGCWEIAPGSRRRG